MFTLSDLKSGLCQGKIRVAMACQLSVFPKELYELADKLEVLDLSNNQLDTLPDDFTRLHKLRILFLSANNFKVFPQVLAKCPQLVMISFKSNQITVIPEHSLPQNIRWLILTDNHIKALPHSIGTHTQLQKLMLAGNHIQVLPDTMRHCKNLELLRISANQLHTLPTWLFTLPKLAWLAFASNPCIESKLQQQPLPPQVNWGELELTHMLGEGASGHIFKAVWQDKHIAVKIFKGAITSDGYPKDEQVASIAAKKHKHLIEVLGALQGHPEQKSGLLLSRIPAAYKNLGNPPSLESCTRDTYPDTTIFSFNSMIDIASAMASVAVHLHQKNISHGDFYAHNILINDEQHCFLGDFGAATLYTNLEPQLNSAMESLEVRAFGCLLEDLLQRTADCPETKQLQQLTDHCLQTDTTQRPSFSKIHQTLISIQAPQEA